MQSLSPRRLPSPCPSRRHRRQLIPLMRCPSKDWRGNAQGAHTVAAEVQGGLGYHYCQSCQQLGVRQLCTSSGQHCLCGRQHEPCSAPLPVDSWTCTRQALPAVACIPSCCPLCRCCTLRPAATPPAFPFLHVEYSSGQPAIVFDAFPSNLASLMVPPHAVPSPSSWML